MQIQDYQTNELIYESVNSSVYRAVRKLDGLPVILKVLKGDYPSPIELIRYKQEYELVRHLKVAGVIKAFGLEKAQNTLVIILEDFLGDSLRNLLNCYQFTLNECLTIADSLGQIHAKNIIHKDINPANIIYRPQTGQLKIIDFGISTQLSRQHFTLKTPSTLEGTLAYISPEQTGRMNRSLDYRSDFYSLGGHALPRKESII
jgi:serine/threonine protein kinase